MSPPTYNQVKVACCCRSYFSDGGVVVLSSVETNARHGGVRQPRPTRRHRTATDVIVALETAKS